MLTALVFANSTPGALAVTLSSLVAAVAEGLVSHAVVILPAPDPAAERIADAMGATVVIAASNHWQFTDIEYKNCKKVSSYFTATRVFKSGNCCNAG